MEINPAFSVAAAATIVSALSHLFASRDVLAGRYDPISYIADFSSCCVWLIYAILSRYGHVLLVASIAGGFIEGLYIRSYAMRAPRQTRAWWISASLPMILFSVYTGIMCAIYRGEERDQALGWCCVVLSCAFYAPSGFGVWEVISSKKTDPFSFLSYISLFVASALWLVYGIMSSNIFVLVPGVAGLVVSVV